MADIVLSGSTSGSCTLAAQAVAGSTTLTLPTTSGTVFTSTGGTLGATTFSANTTFGSAAMTVPSGSAPLYMARAWVNFNGTGTVAIRASGNVSSITDNGTGDYTVNFTTAMSDTNYCVQLSCRNITSNVSSSNNPTYTGSQSTSEIRICHMENNINNDSDFVHVAVFR